MEPAGTPIDPAHVLRHARWMAALARHLVRGGRGDAGADDLVQETWLAYMTQPPRDPAAAGSWLRRVLRNFALRSRRADGRRRGREQRVARPEAHAEDPGDLVARAELLQQVAQRALALEEPYRSTVLLRYFEELEPAEIAQRQEVPLNTVYTRLRRGLETLRAQLDVEHGGRGVWLAVLAPLALLPLAPSSAAAAAGVSASASSLSPGTVVSGGVALAAKKVGFAVSLSACLFLAVGGIVLWSRLPSSGERGAGGPGGSGASGEAAVAARGATPRSTATTADESAAPRLAAEDQRGGAPAALRGRIVDELGAGIEGATVIALDLDAWERRVATELRPLRSSGDGDLTDELAASLASLREAAALAVAERTGPQGAFRFGVLEEGEYRLVAWSGRHLPSTETVVPVPGAAELVIELRSTAALAGRVVDESGQSVPGAVVRTSPSSWRALDEYGLRTALQEAARDGQILLMLGRTESDAAGAFALGGLEPGLHDVSAHKPGWAGGSVLDAPAGGAPVVIVLQRGLTLGGRVIEPDGSAAAGAQIRLDERPRRARPAVAVGESAEATFSRDAVLRGPETGPAARADEDGKFRIAGVTPGRHRMRIEAAGFPPLERELELRESTDLGTVSLAAGGTIAGQVLAPGGAPVARARVWIEAVPAGGLMTWGGRFHAPGTRVEARTDAGGAFRLEGLAPGAYAVRAAAADWSEKLVAGVQTGTQDLRLELAPGFTAKGRVLDGPTGAPLRGARVAVQSGLWHTAVAEKTVETGTGGDYELKGLTWTDERLTFETTHPAYPGAFAGAELSPNEGPAEVTLRLYPSEAMSGRVVAGDGTPVPGAFITCTVQDVSPARSGDDGRFELLLPHLARSYDSFEVSASHATRGIARVAVVRPPEGRPWPRLELELQAPVGLGGRVRDADGSAVARAVLRAFPLPVGDMTGRGSPVTTISGEDGSYRFARLGRGTISLEVEAVGFARARLERIDVEAGGGVQDVVLEKGRVLRGRVMDSGGRPVAGAEAVAFEARELDLANDHGTSQERWRRRHSEVGIATARTDASGSYVVRDLPRAGITLVARAPGHEPGELAVVQMDEDPPAELVVTPLGGLAGRVVDAASGAPLSPFSVWIERATDDGEKTFLPREYDDPGGSFRFEDLAAGRYMTVIVARGRPPEGQWFEVRPGEEASVEIRLPAGQSITGVVKDRESGLPIEGARVMAYQQEGWGQHMPLPTPYVTSTDAGGAFLLEGLAPGKSSLRATRSGYAAKDTAFVIEADADTAPLEVRLRPAGKLECRIANLGTRKVLWSQLVFVRLDDPQRGEEHRGTERGREVMTIDGLRPGRYEVHLQETVAGPNVSPEATSFRAEDMVDRRLLLGEVEIRAGEMARLDATVPAGDGR